jgi:hypothetical protein
MSPSLGISASVAARRRLVEYKGFRVGSLHTLLREDHDVRLFGPLGDVGGKHDITVSTRLAFSMIDFQQGSMFSATVSDLSATLI